MNKGEDRLSLVADVGGTNTRVALAEGPRLRPETVRRYRNADHDGLRAILRDYLGGRACAGACAAVAGPVRDGVAELTNLAWRIDAASLAEATGAARVAILNDLQAQGYGIAHIAPENLRSIVESSARPAPDIPPDAAQLVIGVGTGFNIAPVYHTRTGRFVPAAEAGHASLPVQTEDDLRLAAFVGRKHGFADVEEVLSGRGVENVYAWLGAEAGDERRRPAAEIAAALADGTDPRAVQAARVFVRMLGIVAGDLALIHLPFGGVYFIGGVARSFAPRLAEFGFARAFRAKGRFSGLMEEFAVRVIEDDYAALAGCASHLAALD